MRVSEHFLLQEFCYPELYETFGENALWFIDQRIINIAEFLRTELNKPITINNYHFGGNYKESGLRAFNSYTGTKYSFHRFGKAIDIKVKDVSVKRVFEFIQGAWKQLSKLGLTTVEDIEYTISWIHLDCRNTGSKELLIVKP